MVTFQIGWEAVTLWLSANDRVPYMAFADRPVYFVVLMVAVVFFRLIHWGPLYKACHYVHHKNINIGPCTRMIPANREITQVGADTVGISTTLRRRNPFPQIEGCSACP